MLLCLADKQGTIEFGTWYCQAVAGAVLAELLVSGRVELTTEGKRQLVRVVNSKPLGDPLIDECLKDIRDRKKRDTLQTWVARVAGKRDIKNRVALELCRKGILRADEDKVLLFFSRKIYPEVDPRPERELVERLREAIFRDGSEVDPRTAVSIALASRTGILNATFGKKELAPRKDRIERVAEGQASSAATDQATKAAMDAAMSAIFMTTCVIPVLGS